MHGGLTNRVCDLNWNPNEPNLLVAAAEDNQVQAFIVSDKLMFPGMEGQEEPEASMQDVDA
jgi:histone-binding protein RBBP4